MEPLCLANRCCCVWWEYQRCFHFERNACVGNNSSWHYSLAPWRWNRHLAVPPNKHPARDSLTPCRSVGLLADAAELRVARYTGRNLARKVQKEGGTHVASSSALLGTVWRRCLLCAGAGLASSFYHAQYAPAASGRRVS